jgi:hypothetical protein
MSQQADELSELDRQVQHQNRSTQSLSRKHNVLTAVVTDLSQASVQRSTAFDTLAEIVAATVAAQDEITIAFTQLNVTPEQLPSGTPVQLQTALMVSLCLLFCSHTAHTRKLICLAIVTPLLSCWCGVTLPQSLAQASAPARTRQRTAKLTRELYRLKQLWNADGWGRWANGRCGLQNDRYRVLCPAYANNLANFVATKIRIVITTVLANSKIFIRTQFAMRPETGHHHYVDIRRSKNDGSGDESMAAQANGDHSVDAGNADTDGIMSGYPGMVSSPTSVMWVDSPNVPKGTTLTYTVFVGLWTAG